MQKLIEITKPFLKNKFMSFYATIHILDAHMSMEFLLIISVV